MQGGISGWGVVVTQRRWVWGGGYAGTRGVGGDNSTPVRARGGENLLLETPDVRRDIQDGLRGGAKGGNSVDRRSNWCMCLNGTVIVSSMRARWSGLNVDSLSGFRWRAWSGRLIIDGDICTVTAWGHENE